MTTYDVRVHDKAADSITEASRKDQERIVKKLEALATNPRPSGVEKLTDIPGMWRVRVGQYRIVYRVAVLVVRRRGNVYRELGRRDAVLAKVAVREIRLQLDTSAKGHRLS